MLIDELLAVGTSLGIILSLPHGDEDEDDEPFESTASVRWSKCLPDGRCAVGVQFGGLTAAQKRDLMRLLQG